MGIKRAHFLAFSLCVAALGAASGCGGKNPRASAVPVYDLKLEGRSSGAALVAPGDTLGNIAQRYNLTIADLIRANMLGGHALAPNQRLVLPPPQTYTVKAGDSPERVARMFDTSESALRAANHLQPGTALRLGQVLRIPNTQGRAAAATPGMPMPDTPISDNGPPQGMVLSEPQGMRASSEIQAEPLLPQTNVITASKANTNATAPEKPRPPQTQNPQKGAKHARFTRPLEGRVVSGFGPKAGGLYNDGINIAAKAGTPVNAASGGHVAFAGEGPEGFGKMVLVRHDDGYFTVYSHLSHVSVKEGAQVQAAQMLGRVGATGKVKEPQLHFEIRRGTEALNPEDFL